MATKKAVKKPVNCEVIVELATGTHRGEGATIEEAFLNIPLEFLQVKSKGTIKLRQGEQTLDKFFPITILRRMFTTKTAKAHWANMLSKFLK